MDFYNALIGICILALVGIVFIVGVMSLGEPEDYE